MSSVIEQIKQITRQLFPQGRAFKAALEGVRERLQAGLSLSEERAYNDAVSVLDSAVADSVNFTEDDAEDWERRLGLTSLDGASLSSRIIAINNKLNYPITNAPRQHHSFLEQQLRDAGFDVYVYENNFSGLTKTPQQILSPGLPNGANHSIGTHHGDGTRHGAITFYYNKIVNYIDEGRDAHFIIGANYRSTFFISGPTLETFANVPAERKAEFRQLILRLKPVHAVGFLFLNYT